MRHSFFIFFVCKIFVIYFYCSSSPIYISGKSYNGNRFYSHTTKNFWQLMVFKGTVINTAAAAEFFPSLGVFSWEQTVSLENLFLNSTLSLGVGTPGSHCDLVYVHGQFKSLPSHEVSIPQIESRLLQKAIQNIKERFVTGTPAGPTARFSQVDSSFSCKTGTFRSQGSANLHVPICILKTLLLFFT